MGVISTEKGFVFIHMPKTAGASLTAAIAPYGKSFLQFPGLAAHAAGKGGIVHPEHMRARDVVAFVGQEKWSELYTFGFVRNPWDRMVALYHYTRQTPAHRRHKEVLDMTFGQFVAQGGDGWLPPVPMWDWLTDDDGNQIVCDVFRFEDLQENYPRILKNCGISDAPALPFLNASRHGPYQGYYTGEIREMVAKYFALEIERFAYRF